jgi:hypothetical protein
LCVIALRMLFSFVASFNELEGKRSHGRCLHVSACEKFSNFFLKRFCSPIRTPSLN